MLAAPVSRVPARLAPASVISGHQVPGMQRTQSPSADMLGTNPSLLLKWRIKGTSNEKGQALRGPHNQPGSQKGFLVLMQRVELGGIMGNSRNAPRRHLLHSRAAGLGLTGLGRQGGGESREARRQLQREKAPWERCLEAVLRVQ